MPRLTDYWKTDKLFNLNCFREVMSRKRYMLIMHALHFSRNPECGAGVSKPSWLYKIDTVVEYFKNCMLEVYQPSKQLSLDKQGTDSTLEKSHTEHVVYRLMENHLDKGHSLFMDNYYNSSSLAHTLLQRKTYCTGTLRNNRKIDPKEVISKKLKTGESVCKYTKGGVCIVKWKDKREVLAISSEFKNEMVEVHNKYGQSKLKPLPISEYNKFMSGIDRQDQMMSYYPCERKTLRCKENDKLESQSDVLLANKISTISQVNSEEENLELEREKSQELSSICLKFPKALNKDSKLP
ncbi:piggyBac transposable element-derived protein 4-like [Melanaphis sacchari]|uniref:piggyBac transposable element-derived protein 4-like n=1 Tax=Melanaphis sacchari TaxID=742174 RepID=UPI000DC13723|nr:piggyBac transposable element-derived protein 4-like [Melanaphis sacchari]